jgi:hypothetical protein
MAIRQSDGWSTACGSASTRLHQAIHKHRMGADFLSFPDLLYPQFVAWTIWKTWYILCGAFQSGCTRRIAHSGRRIFVSNAA